MGISKDLQLGRVGEEFVRDIFKKCDIKAELHDNPDTRSHYDLQCKVGRKKFTVEVKFDVMAQKTGNLAIEFYNPKSAKPSGIDATKADLWAQIIYDGGYKVLYLTSVKLLKKFLKDNPPFRTISCGGDDNASLYLYKDFDILDSIFIRIDNIDCAEVKKKVKELLK